jgi:hypothetical protein
MKILSITCDNASNNDTMIEELTNLLDDLPGPANQTWCFTHILNLIVKSVIRQFDSPNSKNDQQLDDAANEMLSFASNLEFEREEGEDGEDDNVEGWIDERTLMTEEELEKLDESVEPLRLLLTNVSF